tara:strand:+ start:484 stop:609 length:126 start_codon:yes stop_codon:yes gene_type:complete
MATVTLFNMNGATLAGPAVIPQAATTSPYSVEMQVFANISL